METHCCGCKRQVDAVPITGDRIYGKKYSELLLWQCPECKNYVGAHKRTNLPLGTIPTPELRELRKRLHLALDPLWQNKLYSRTSLYRKISNFVGYEFHIGSVNSEEEYNKVLPFIRRLHE